MTVTVIKLHVVKLCGYVYSNYLFPIMLAFQPFGYSLYVYNLETCTKGYCTHGKLNPEICDFGNLC